MEENKGVEVLLSGVKATRLPASPLNSPGLGSLVRLKEGMQPRQSSCKDEMGEGYTADLESRPSLPSPSLPESWMLSHHPGLLSEARELESWLGWDSLELGPMVIAQLRAFRKTQWALSSPPTLWGGDLWFRSTLGGPALFRSSVRPGEGSSNPTEHHSVELQPFLMRLLLLRA